MNCKACNIEVIEGNYVILPTHKKTPQGIIASVQNVILCDVCIAKVQGQIIRSAKVSEGEIVINAEL